MARTEKDSRKSRGVDVSVTGEGPMTTVFLFHLHTAATRQWVDEYVSDERTMLGEALAVEHRYAGQLAEGMLGDGLVVE